MKQVQSQVALPEGFTPIRELGSGAGTAVLEVKDSGTGKLMVIKLATSPDPAHRLEREYVILKRFDHPGIVRVYDFGYLENLPYFTMERVNGKPFNAYIGQFRSKDSFVPVFLEVLVKTIAILSTVHHQGMVHSDVKPANLLVRPGGKPVLLDFGFAEDYLLEHERNPAGTLDYAAPELFMGENIGPQSDLYSMGVMAYEALLGK
ncbi:protein kinase, partial [candidate division WOR-3 bacterium]|nr:protein kinase [candidate division WOR-3 bacterium]MBD3365040.1 protein kinase [candidate division WOR-3 bacterium]